MDVFNDPIVIRMINKCVPTVIFSHILCFSVFSNTTLSQSNTSNIHSHFIWIEEFAFQINSISIKPIIFQVILFCFQFFRVFVSNSSFFPFFISTYSTLYDLMFIFYFFFSNVGTLTIIWCVPKEKKIERFYWNFSLEFLVFILHFIYNILCMNWWKHFDLKLVLC